MKRFVILFLLVIILVSAEYSQETDKSKIARLKWTGPGRPGTYEEYIASFPAVPFTVWKMKDFSQWHQGNTNLGFQNILVLVDSLVFSNLSWHINRYVSDLSEFYDVLFYTSYGGTPEELKSFIKERQDDLAGCVFIGRLPAAWYEVVKNC